MKYLSLLIVLLLTLTACASQAEQAINDATLTAQVKTRLASYANINALKINVDTQAGVVTLRGEVPTAAEKAEAERLARETAGVQSVVNNITVNPDTLGASTVKEKAQEATRDVGQEAGEILSNAAVVAAVKARLVAAGVIGTDIDVLDGEVTLRGAVSNEQERARAVEIARTTSGVKSVRNLLTIKEVGSRKSEFGSRKSEVGSR